MKEPIDIDKELDAVVGLYDEGRGERFWRRYGRRLGRAVAAATLAVASAGLIAFILHKHAADAQTAPAPKKPVTVRVIPAGS